MSKVLNSADKAWITRRANEAAAMGKAAPAKAAAPANAAPAAPEADIIMYIRLSIPAADTDSMPAIMATFQHELAGKPVSSDKLSSDQLALEAITLVSHVIHADSGIVFSGHGNVCLSIQQASASELQSILPMMVQLDSMLATTREDSEDSSLPMAMQALSWNRRVAWVDYDGKRSKRGSIYPLIEGICSEVAGLYGKPE
jgi:hypothetical protein